MATEHSPHGASRQRSGEGPHRVRTQLTNAAIIPAKLRFLKTRGDEKVPVCLEAAARRRHLEDLQKVESFKVELLRSAM